MFFGCMKMFINQMDSPWSSCCRVHPIYKGRAISHYHHSSAPVPVVDIYSSSSPFETSFIGHRCQNRCKAETEKLVFERRENWRSLLSWLVGDLLPTLGAGVMLGVGRNLLRRISVHETATVSNTSQSTICDSSIMHLAIYSLYLLTSINGKRRLRLCSMFMFIFNIFNVQCSWESQLIPRCSTHYNRKIRE